MFLTRTSNEERKEIKNVKLENVQADERWWQWVAVKGIFSKHQKSGFGKKQKIGLEELPVHMETDATCLHY